MSGFTIRRFLMQNILAVAMHSPIRVVAETAAVVNTGTPLSTAVASAGTSSSLSFSRLSATIYRVGQSMLIGCAYEYTGNSRMRGHSNTHDRDTHGSTGRSGSSGSGFALMSEEEMRWVRQRRLEDAEESRVVLSVRPSRSLLRGFGGALLNLGMGCFCAPLIFLSITLERLRMSSGELVAVGLSPVYGVAWSSVFVLIALYAALQQSLLCVYYALVATPMHYIYNRRCTSAASEARYRSDAHCPSRQQSSPTPVKARLWCPLTCRFECPGTTHSTHAALVWYASEEQVRERGMRRLAKRQRASSSSSSSSSAAAYGAETSHVGSQRSSSRHPHASSSACSADEVDYYTVLRVPRDATPRQIREAYNRAVLSVHPDHNSQPNAAAEFDIVTRAYRVLSHPERRRRYDVAGLDGVNNVGAKKREAVRAMFGGELLHPLTGDVLCGSFLLRVIDGLDCTAEELAVLRQRRSEVARDELVNQYLRHFRAGAGGSALFDAATMTRLRSIATTGLAKEVLYILGQEYARVIAHFDAGTRIAIDGGIHAHRATMAYSAAAADVCSTPTSSNRARRCVSAMRWWCGMPWRRVRLYVSQVAPHRWRHVWRRARCLSRLRARTLKDSSALVDLVWYSSVRELEETAASAAHAVLYDPMLSDGEVQRRREALLALSQLFIQLGQRYKGANSTTMSQLMDSLRAYNHQKEQQKYAS